MRILLLLGTFNFPPRNGGDQALVNAIKQLRQHVEFHLISVAESTDCQTDLTDFRQAFPNIPATSYIIHKNNKYRKITTFLSRIANAINRRNGNSEVVDMQQEMLFEPRTAYLHDFYQYINQYIADNRIDIVQSEFWFTLGRLIGITADVKRLFIQHEIQYVVNTQRLLQRNHSDSDLRLQQIMRKSEINAMNACDAIITLSKDDKQRLIKDGVHTPIFSSFAQVQFKKYIPKVDLIHCNKLVFIGPESHMPNRHGLQWFLDNVWPIVQDQKPWVTLDIIGRWSEDTSKEWTGKYSNIHFSGFVDDLTPALTDSILIVPIFQGSGIRMKILEACNLGAPVVSSTIGAEGLGLIDSQNAFITDDAKRFVQNILTLLESPEIATNFVANANKHIETSFSDESFIDSRMKCYNFLCGNSPV